MAVTRWFTRRGAGSVTTAGIVSVSWDLVLEPGYCVVEPVKDPIEPLQAV